YIIACLDNVLYSQPFGNEWINYGQKYYRIPVAKTGLYRINRQTLLDAGFNINSISPKNIQLFARGQEQYIYVHGEDDGVFNTNDYIEFYGQANDGLSDTLLYDNSADLVNPYLSMINDTIYYFLTWNNSTNNKRITQETDTNFQSYLSALASHCYVEKIFFSNSQYYYGDIGSWYNNAEGWAGDYSEINAPRTFTINSENFVNVSRPIYLDFTCFSASNAPFNGLGNHHIKLSFNNQVLLDSIFVGYKKISKSLVLNQTLPAVSQIHLESVNDLYINADKNVLSNARLYYPHNFHFSTVRQKFDIENSPMGKTYIELTLPNTTNLILWDIANHKRILTVYENGKYKALIPNGIEPIQCFYNLEDSIYQAKLMPAKIYTDYAHMPSKADYLIITNALLTSSANQYANYRNQTGYQSMVIDVDQLYDQFSYGVPKSPIAIQQFLRYYNYIHPSLVKHVFIIGKAIHSEMIRFNSQRYAECLVPTFGTPPSDELLVKWRGLSKPLFSIGRLAATNNNEVSIYLNKIIQYESAGAEEWQKRVLHFGGGVSTSEQIVFSGYLNSLAQIIQDTMYAGFVQTFLKTTSLPIQITVSDSIRNLINDGCSIMNFFGHGTSGGFDQNIDEPSSYNNYGRYPLLLANTCLSGDIHLPDYKRISENWVIIPNKGAIAFLASTDMGNAAYLFIYSEEFYKQITYKNFGKPIGLCINETINELLTASNNNDLIKNTCFDVTLHGDPAIKMAVNTLPDLTIKNQDIRFYPTIVSSDIDTFEVHVIITNYGKAVIQPYVVDLIRTFSDGSQEVFSKIRNSCFYKDTVVFRIPVDIIKGPGVNKFCARVDVGNWISEYNENNNEACVDFTITISDIVPVYPYEYAIYPYDTVTLKASTGYPFLQNQTYIFEIDTTDLFNSPWKKTQIVNHQGGVVTWSPPVLLSDCTVYFWHVAVNNGSNFNWKESSFIYIPQKTGWSQAHFFQFKKDRYVFMEYNRPQRSFDFIVTPRQLRCQTRGMGAASSYFQYQYNLEGIVERSSCSPTSAMLVVVIDPQTILPWESNRANYGHINYPICPGKNRPDYYYVFPTDANHLDLMANFIRDSIPNGYYILMYNFLLGNFSNWTENAYQALEELGAVQIRTVPNNGAYIFFCKKGDFSFTQERVGGVNDSLLFTFGIPVNYTSGTIYSTLIGPSSKWKTLHWLPKAKEYPSKDLNYLSLMAYKANFDSSIVIQKMSPDTLDLYNLEQYVDVATFPYLRMSVVTSDDSIKTPTQLVRWQITYDGVPETAINPEKGFFFYKDTVQEGETVKFAVATQNIGMYDMDSLLVRYWIQDKNNNVIPLAIKRLRKHPVNDVLIDTISFSTIGYSGLNRIWYEVNCVNPNSGTYDQLEQSHFNNIAEKAFYVQTDKINPLLDVTFDGVRILDGDIVSSKPNIVVQLKDENKYLALNDTSLFAIYLTDMKSNIEKRIYFTNPDNNMTFFPAQLPHNSCKIIFNPVLTDGKYMLRVQAKDVSNNISGFYDYTIHFEVITKQTISHVLNYPNPFSTSTRFVFTLTGSELPDDIRIRIFTISGKVVKEIFKHELGPIHIGRNITEYAWDGTDMYGDKLANGVYFYEVEARSKGAVIEHRQTEADKFFKHNFGKLYILR
ncbi:MAG: putative type IX secretion system sortase PorU2, partial [Bacteroidales bacterium]